MTDSEYVPGEREVRADFVLANTRNFDSYQVGRTLASEQKHYGDEFDRWLNQVKAEAAREALTQYASEFEGEGSEWIGPMGPTLIARDVRNFITEHYPEEQK
ncbi:hypothetical protein HMPREF1484_00234 [Dermabacter sp. HFH0086]|uniref:hypothetical protein n=1 Tax=Dermabacter TaxID=36739 RepID=UPI000352BFD9|nr:MULTISPECIES: hypothetical protein [Dermabacter]EPH17549.1 hypothetical protein HMPREF1484_00234 [Dermabacter sp. HFH0086]